jgi:hypothetical protein
MIRSHAGVRATVTSVVMIFDTIARIARVTVTAAGISAHAAHIIVRAAVDGDIALTHSVIACAATRGEDLPRGAEDQRNCNRADRGRQRAHRGKLISKYSHPQMQCDVVQPGLAGIQMVLRPQHFADRWRRGGRPRCAFVRRHFARSQIGATQIAPHDQR